MQREVRSRNPVGPGRGRGESSADGVDERGQRARMDKVGRAPKMVADVDPAAGRQLGTTFGLEAEVSQYVARRWVVPEDERGHCRAWIVGLGERHGAEPYRPAQGVMVVRCDDGGVTASTLGRLLVASPDLEDPNFRRTVVLMLTHDVEGALGLVLNRPTDIPVGDELPDWAAVCAAPACLYIGGPVDPDNALGLGEGPPDRSEMIVGLVGAVDFAGRPEDYRSVRVFAGYAGWGPSQLDLEVSRGDWIVVDALVDDVTTATPDSLWREVLRRQRGRVSVFATAPDDASTN